MELQVIKNQQAYEAALAEMNRLMELDPLPETQEGRRLELLFLIIENYEKEIRSEELPDPINAIKFRMEQQNLRTNDLIPFIGSRSKVSEVLSRKRPLSLSMIRALTSGLGIPAKVLLQESEIEQGMANIEWERFPVKEMIRRGWIQGTLKEIKNIDVCMGNFFAPVGGPKEVAALYMKSERSGRPMDKYALAAWTARIMSLALETPPQVSYVPGTVTLDFMREVVSLSGSQKGPLKAQNLLRKNGISLVVETALPQTYLDGAAIMTIPEKPIIGLSLRYDRIDNFWFCLMHELAHISLHYGKGVNQFYDDLDIKQTEDPKEREADDLARNALIPDEAWEMSAAKVLKTKEAAQSLANKLDIHVAIVAGRMRREHNSYHLFNDLVGHGQIRSLFFEKEFKEELEND